MRKLILALILLAPSLAFAQTPTPVLQKFPGWKLCEDGRIGGDCVSVGPMPSLAGPLSCPLQADSTPFDNCVTAPTAVPTSAPVATPTPNPPGGVDGNLQIKSGGGFAAYAGVACPTPGFAIASSASGGWTCATPVPPTPQPTATPGAGSGDITDVWSCTSGNCDALTAGAGDSFDTGSADSSKPTTRSTALPGTCAEGQHHQDTDSLGAETYICTAANTWVRLAGEAAALTSGRVALVGTGGLLTDSANNTFDATNFRQRYQNLTTANDNSTTMFQASGTMPASPTGAVEGFSIDITGAGSAAQLNDAFAIDYLAGFTGAQINRALSAINRNSGTAGSLVLGATGSPVGNVGLAGTVLKTAGVGGGYSYGGASEARDSSGVAVGHYMKAADAEAGTNYGGIASARNSTEATGAKDVGFLATLSTTEPTFGNISVALAADNGDQAHPIFNAYDNGALVFSIVNGGGLTTTGGAAGLSATTTVRDAAGTGTCTLIFTNGLKTGGSC